MAKKNTSLASLVAEFEAQKSQVSVPETTTISLTADDLQKIISQAVAAALGAASAPAPATKPAKATAPKAPAPVATPTPKKLTDAALLAKAKTDECFKAAKAACKANGFGSDRVNGSWVDRPNGSRFSNPTGYWTCYWAGYNAKATELGIPTQAPTK